RGLSVRDTEKLARERKPPRVRDGDRADQPIRSGERDPDIVALEGQLADLLGLQIRIDHGDEGGRLTIGYSTLDQLDMVCQRLTGGEL
ncbi:MAG TPA: chromosome partitioning protein ParB, partial [Sphingomonas sp.]